MNEKQKRFCEEYVIDLNATQAAKRSGYSQNRSQEIGYQLLQKTEIQDYIAELRLQQQEKAKIEVADIVRSFVNLATYDVNDYYHNTYTLSYFKDTKGKRAKRKYGEVLSESDYKALPKRYKQYYYKTQKLKEFSEMTKDQRAAIQGLKYDKYGNLIIQLSNKQQALDSLARHLGMFIDKSEVKSEAITRIINVNPTKAKA